MVNVSSTSTRGLGVAEQGEATVPELRFPGRGHSSLQAVLGEDCEGQNLGSVKAITQLIHLRLPTPCLPEAPGGREAEGRRAGFVVGKS